MAVEERVRCMKGRVIKNGELYTLPADSSSGRPSEMEFRANLVQGGFAFEVQLSITEKGRYAAAYGLSCKKDCHELHTTDPRRTIPYLIPVPLKPSENPISPIRSSFNTSTPLSAANSIQNKYAPTCANTSGSRSITAPFTATFAKTKVTAAPCGNILEYAANPTANATAAHGPEAKCPTASA